MKRTIVVIFFIVLLSCILSAQQTYKEMDVQNGGTIRGTVRLKGEPSKVGKWDITKDQAECGRVKSSPCLKVGLNNGVQNAIVYLDGILAGKRRDNRSLTLDQQKCEFVPHVIVAPLGSQLEILNNDPILHNVHAYEVTKAPVDPVQGPPTVFNIALPLKGQRRVLEMDKPGFLLTLCDAGHPWMSAHVLVVEHPYFALTDSNGNFVLDRVPAGSYKIKMWHEGIPSNVDYLAEKPYEITKQVSVSQKGTVTADFDLIVR